MHQLFHRSIYSLNKCPQTGLEHPYILSNSPIFIVYYQTNTHHFYNLYLHTSNRTGGIAYLSYHIWERKGENYDIQY